MAVEPAEEQAIFLSMHPPGRGERRLAIAAVLVTVVLFAILAPRAGEPIARTPIFIPIYQSALVVCDLITAILLFREFAILRTDALLVLGSGYLFSATMAVFHMLSFPGLFASTGLLGAGPQTTAWLYFLWHLGFPAAVIGYAIMKNDRLPPVPAGRSGAGLAVAAASVAAVGVATAMVLATTAGHDVLPIIMRGDQDMPAKYVLAWVTWLVTLAALPLLWRHGRLSVLDLWLVVVICAWLCDVGQAAVFNSGRFSLGWYAGRAYGLLASSFLLAGLIFEDGRLYRRLAESYASEHTQRRLVEARTADLDAMNRSLEQRVAERTAEVESSNIELRRSRETLRDVAARGATAREQERHRLARELHDELDQALLVLKIELGRLEKNLAAGNAGVSSIFSGLCDLIDGTLAATQRIAADLRPLILDDLGFAPAIHWLVEGFRSRHGIACALEMDPPDFNLVEPHSTVLFRILQESLTNVARHADASSVHITLRRRADEIVARVRDDGRGFDVAALRRADSFGLLGLRERVHLVSGSIRIDSTPGAGVTIDVSIPLSNEQEG